MGEGKYLLIPSLNVVECFPSIIRNLIPSFRIVKLERAVINISAVIEHTEWQTVDAVSALQEEVHGLSHGYTEQNSYWLHKEVYMLLLIPLVVLMWT